LLKFFHRHEKSSIETGDEKANTEPFRPHPRRDEHKLVSITWEPDNSIFHFFSQDSHPPSHFTCIHLHKQQVNLFLSLYKCKRDFFPSRAIVSLTTGREKKAPRAKRVNKPSGRPFRPSNKQIENNRRHLLKQKNRRLNRPSTTAHKETGLEKELKLSDNSMHDAASPQIHIMPCRQEPPPPPACPCLSVQQQESVAAAADTQVGMHTERFGVVVSEEK